MIASEDYSTSFSGKHDNSVRGVANGAEYNCN